jgi:hypothetical protein
VKLSIIGFQEIIQFKHGREPTIGQSTITARSLRLIDL